MLWNGIIMILPITISGITQRPLWIKAIKRIWWSTWNEIGRGLKETQSWVEKKIKLDFLGTLFQNTLPIFSAIHQN